MIFSEEGRNLPQKWQFSSSWFPEERRYVCQNSGVSGALIFSLFYVKIYQ